MYRGYPISELAENAGFEETAYLILKGSLPKRAELGEFASNLSGRMHVDPRVFSVMRELGTDAHPIDALRTAVSAMGSIERLRTVGEQQTSIEAKVSVLAANCHRVPRGEDPWEPRKGMGFASNLLQMLTRREASEYERWVFERVLIFYMEHDLNASSFTVRIVASTLADPYAAATAGLAALKGPLHGGANEVAMQMLLEIGEPANAAGYVERSLKEGKKVIGFGHRVYKKFDPRARLCKEYLREMLKKGASDDRLYRLCDALEKEMWERKRLPPNLDYYAAPIFHLLGIEIPLYTPIFAASRAFGWMAHYDEQVAENKLIRPDATYVGPSDLKYLPLDMR
ncbi:MAG: citrate/2-methylcitrate synthase [Thaumarchaeota archaeon]|nr:citrate/2-methylcitrate synthase [Nitrososphaerota archaeon]